MRKVVGVYNAWSEQAPVRMGILNMDSIRGSETYSFIFNDAYLEQRRGNFYVLDPQLYFAVGPQYSHGKELFGLFQDATPDRWGRNLMQKRERFLAEEEGRTHKRLTDSDYLLSAYDATRMGGLRFSMDDGESFIANDEDFAISPWLGVRELESAVSALEQDEGWQMQREAVRRLLNQGSSLGGARPKAVIKDTKGELWIAKFPSRNDDVDVGAWEMVCHDLAVMCGLCVPEAKLQRYSKYGSTYLSKRFDRQGERRIHMATAMTMLERHDHDDEMASYTEIAEFLYAYSCQPQEDLRELWKRILFNVLVGNTDDHLRNHSFLLTPHGWRLSPLYDVNPNPYKQGLSLNITDTDNSRSVDLVFEVIDVYDIKKKQAEKIVQDMSRVVTENWQAVAGKYALSRADIMDMKPAFLETL